MSTYVGSFRTKDVPHCVSFGHNVDQMPTAIVSIRTDEGFVIGADGLRKDLDGSVVTETAQKIFTFRRGHLSLLYSWSGSTTLIRPDGVSFDFLAVTKSTLSTANLYSVDSFSQFAAWFAAAIYAQLRFSFGLTFRPSSATTEVARLLFVGYFRDKAYKAQFFVPLVNSTILEPVVEEIGECFPGDLVILSGSKWVFEEFFANKPILSEIDKTPKALTFINKYIQTCIDHQDKDRECSNIGGHIHIAALTPDGFQWVVEPQQKTS